MPGFGHAPLIWCGQFATSGPMTIARISEIERKTTQSGKANTGRWLLEFERQQAQRADPLTGWNGSGDTNTQVRLTFPTKEAAIAYCTRTGSSTTSSRRRRCASRSRPTPTISARF